jgi:PAS domain S-box-containing protein
LNSSSSGPIDAPVILLVEDEAIIAMAESKELEHWGYKVVTAYRGEDAIELSRTTPIDLILMDIDLGRGMDGTEAARRILAERDVPVIFLSSHSEPDVLSRTEEITSYGYVVKNSNYTVIDASIRMAFRLHDAYRRERELKERHQRYLDLVAEIVLTLDRNGTIITLNESGHSKLGYAQGELIGVNWFETCLPGDIRDEVRERLQFYPLSTAEDIVHFENDIITGEGKRLRILWHNTLLTDSRGEVTGILSSGEDITERTRLREELQDERQSLRHLTALQDLLIKVATGFMSRTQTLDSALEVLGAGIGADRAYVFRYDYNRGIAVNTHEWCAPGVESQIEELQDVPLHALSEALDRHTAQRAHHVPDVADLPQGIMRSILEPQGILSLLTVPVFSDGTCIGAVGFDFVRDHHSFSEQEQQLLTLFARGLAEADGNHPFGFSVTPDVGHPSPPGR